VSRFLHEFFFLGAAILVGALSLLPALASFRRQILWSSSLLLLGALMLVGRNLPWLDHILPTGSPLPSAALSVVSWAVAALLGVTFLKFALNRWFFPESGQPRARKLFADLMAGLIYIIAGIGMLEAVFGPPLSGLLATSGVVAVVVGLALQSTLADLFAGLALNIERPFRAGDWIGIAGGAEGQILEINWRATRLKTRAGDLVVVPNGVLARSVVANHYSPSGTHLVSVSVTFGSEVDPNIATRTLLEAGRRLPLALDHPAPSACLLSAGPLGIAYELDFYVADYVDVPQAASDALREIWHAAARQGIALATPHQKISLERTAGSVLPLAG
jgi:small-conductance mechanosensitive channel